MMPYQYWILKKIKIKNIEVNIKEEEII